MFKFMSVKNVRNFLIGWLLLGLAGSALAAELIIPTPPQLSATGYLLIDATTGTALVEFNADQPLPPASLTKIMTSYVAAAELDRGTISLDDEVLISVKAWRTEGSKMFIREGTGVSFEDLLRGIIIQSGNDASVALAEHTAGSEGAFADLMTQHARQLEMHNTSFVNATGLPDARHVSTARDLAKLTVAHINRFPQIYSIYSEREFTYNDIRQANRNKLLWRDARVDGVKTGYTEAAGFCLVASAEQGNTRLISVVMGADSEETRLGESQQLLSYGFRYYETASLYQAQESLKQVRVWGGQQASVRLGLEQELLLTIPKGSRNEFKAEVNIQEEVHAPFAEGDDLGSLRVIFPDGKDIAMPLQALSGIQEANLFSRLWDAIVLFFLKLTGGDPLAVAV